MENHTLPTEDLKKFGIFDKDNTFTKKLSENDIQRFLKGDTIVADNDKNRITFQLVENNSKLNVNIFQRDKNISEILKNSKNTIEYSNIENTLKKENEKKIEQKAFVFNPNENQIIEYDLIKDAKELTQIILDKNNTEETNKYKNELLKLKGFLQDKIDQFPEIAKEINNDINILDNEINSVNSITRTEKQTQKEGKEDIQLGVNDPDLYEQANQKREEIEQDEETQKSRGFRR